MSDPNRIEPGQRKVHYGARVFEKLTPSNIMAKIQYETRAALAPIYINRSPLRSSTFGLWGKQLPYWLHRYNTTWRNERCIEVAAAINFLNENPAGRCLEFGNVLRNYGIRRPDVVIDLYEHAAGVTNVDIVDYYDSTGFQLIVSLSTLEHVGWDEHPQQPEKALDALKKMRSFLHADGLCLVSVPLGCNPALDEYICSGQSDSKRSAAFVRIDGGWAPTDSPILHPYNSKGPGAASVWIAEFGPLNE
jgi:hypothetical protein